MTEDAGLQDQPDASATKTGEPSAATTWEAVGDEEEELGLGHELAGEELPIGRVAAGRNAFNQCNIHVWGDFDGGSGEASRAPVAVIDATADMSALAASFVEPPHAAELRRMLEEQKLVLLTGEGCGNRTAACVALHQAGHRPILELPAGIPAATLVNTVDQLCRRHPRAGIVVAALDRDALAGYAGFELRRLRRALGQEAAAALTARAATSATEANELPTLPGVPPDTEQLVRAVARQHRLTDEEARLAQETAKLLPPPVAPTTAVSLVEAARSGEHATPETLAAVFAWQSTALAEWLTERPTAAAVASLAAAATLDRVPSPEVEAAAAALERRLEGEHEPAAEPKRFGPADRGWPPAVVELGRRPVPTPFGRQEAEVVQLRTPHRREHVVRHLWRELGVDFRRAYLDWLRELPAAGGGRVRVGAGITAGVLFVEDPLLAEQELLRPWAFHGMTAQRGSAALALGVPTMIGADCTPARMLANHWIASSNPRLRRTAIATFGGPLGAWDTGAAAPLHLWRAAEGREDRTAADAGLADLVAAGAEAQQVRATVLQLLVNEVGKRPHPKRSFELLPRLMRRLTAGDAAARGSLASLVSDEEHQARSAFASLIAQAFDASTGYASAAAALRALLDALAANRIDRDTVNRLVRATKAAAPPGRRSALGSQIQRVLRAEMRADGPRSDAARAVHATFYSSP